MEERRLASNAETFYLVASCWSSTIVWNRNFADSFKAWKKKKNTKNKMKKNVKIKKKNLFKTFPSPLFL